MYIKNSRLSWKIMKRYNVEQLFRALTSMQMLTNKLKQQFPGDVWAEVASTIVVA